MLLFCVVFLIHTLNTEPFSFDSITLDIGTRASSFFSVAISFHVISQHLIRFIEING